MSDTISKMAMYSGIAVAGYIAYNKVMNDDSKPEKRKHRQSLTLGQLDKQIDERNNAFGKRVPANPDVPFYSRHNYNRRRRPNHII